MTSRLKLRQTLRKMYEGNIEYLVGNISLQKRMLGEFLDSEDYASAAAVNLVVAQDEQELEILRDKLELVNDDSYFESMLKKEQEEEQ